MAIGRPIELTPNIATKNISSLATDSQTQFTVTGGYRINEIAVYRNGVRLAEGRDFTASDGDTVNLVTAATVDDFLWKDGYDKFVYLWRNDDNGNGVRPIFWEICEEYMAVNPALKD